MQNLGQVANEIGVKVRCGARVEQLRMEVVLDVDTDAEKRTMSMMMIKTM